MISFDIMWFNLVSCWFIWFHLNPFLHGARKGKGNMCMHKGKGKNRRDKREKGKASRDKREKGKGTTDDLPEISLDQAPRARTYARTARHETISRLDYPPPNLRYTNKPKRSKSETKHVKNTNTWLWTLGWNRHMLGGEPKSETSGCRTKRDLLTFWIWFDHALMIFYNIL